MRDLPTRPRTWPSTSGDPAKLQRHLASGELQIAFVVFAQGAPAEQAKEIVLTPVRDERGEATGFLFLGLDAATADERAFLRAQDAQGSAGRTGLVIDGEWHLPGLNEVEAENMAPQEVIVLLNQHMTALTRIVHAHGGVVDKFVGDLVMALFGAPLAYGDDTRQAARCALAMVTERARLNRESPQPIEIGIGLACGAVVAGCMGPETRLNYTVLGERFQGLRQRGDQAALRRRA